MPLLSTSFPLVCFVSGDFVMLGGVLIAVLYDGLVGMVGSGFA